MSASVAEKLRNISSRITVDTTEIDALQIALAEEVVRRVGLNEHGARTLVRFADNWWKFRDGHHHLVETEEMRALVWSVLPQIDLEYFDKQAEKKKKRKLDPNKHTVSGVLDAMAAIIDRIPASAELPYALPGYKGPLGRVVVVRNGLVNPSNDELHPATPRLFATAGAAVDFDPAALCPAWEKFLASIFSDEDGTDKETIRLVRQIFGWLLAGDTTRHSIPLIVGPPRSGKSTMMSILRGLLGEGNVCAPPISMLGKSQFGLAPLIGKSVAIIPDARLSSQADQALIAGLLLIVSGHDPVEIDRKNQPSIKVRLGCRIVIVTNELPRIHDASGALSSRFLVVETRASFLGKEDRGLEDRLRRELPGIMRWALIGWRDLEANGWVRPSRTQEIVDELDRLGSPIKAFIKDRLEVYKGAETTIETLYAQWQHWCQAQGRKEPGTVQSFGRDMRAALPAGVTTKRPRTEAEDAGGKKERRTTVYVGLAVKPPEQGAL